MDTAAGGPGTPALSAGDRDAFDELYRGHVRAVQHFVESAAVDRHAIEDVVAESFLCAWQSRRHVPAGGDAVRDWLLGMARAALERHRSMTAERDALGRRLQERIAGPDIADEVVRRAEVRVLLSAAGSALDRLPPQEREVVCLYAGRGLVYSEIAATLRVPLGTVRARLFRGRRRLWQLTLQESVRLAWRRTRRP